MFASCAGMAGATLLLAGHMYSLPDEATTEACTDSDGAGDTGGIPPDCVSWNDGCNTCDVKGGQLGACTEMACFEESTPYCVGFAGTYFV